MKFFTLFFIFISSSTFAFSAKVDVSQFRHTICYTNNIQAQMVSYYLTCHYKNVIGYISKVENHYLSSSREYIGDEYHHAKFSRIFCFEDTVISTQLKIRKKGFIGCQLRVKTSAINPKTLNMYHTPDDISDAMNTRLTVVKKGLLLRSLSGPNGIESLRDQLTNLPYEQNPNFTKSYLYPTYFDLTDEYVLLHAQIR